MFTVNDDLSIYATRGDIVFFTVEAEDNGVAYKFQPGDVVRIKVYGRKDAENVVLQKDFPVTAETESVEVYLTEEDTKIGAVISKPTDYWYEVELNPYNNPQTIIGYDEDGAKVFKLFPEGDDIPEYVPSPEELPEAVDNALDISSPRPVENRAIARAIVHLEAAQEETATNLKEQGSALRGSIGALDSDIAVERARVDNLVASPTPGNSELIDIRVGADGKTYGSAGTAVREQIAFLDDGKVDKDGSAQVTLKNTDFSVVVNGASKNRIDPDAIATGYYITDAGEKYANSNYGHTGFIPVSEGEVLVLSVKTGGGTNAGTNIRYLCAYDENKNVLSGLGGANLTSYEVPATVCYVVVSQAGLGGADSFQLEATLTGNFTAFEEYRKAEYKIAPNAIAKEIDAFLPDYICCAVGRTIELYNNQVCLQAEKYNMNWVCPVGKAMKRKFSITGTDNNVGTHTLTLNIIDDNMDIVWSKSIELRIVRDTAPVVPILPIGDSLTNAKAWLSELIYLSSGNISFVGTRTEGSPGIADSSGVRRIMRQEGRSGASAKWYLENRAYTYDNKYVGNPDVDYTQNPFYSVALGRFSYSHYLETQGSYIGGTPKAIVLFLGTNGIAVDPTENANAIKGIVDNIRKDNATIPIFVVNTIYRGNQNGIGVQVNNDGYASFAGAYKYEEDKKVFNLMARLQELLSGYTGVALVPVALAHDSEYNFGSVETPVNPRAKQVEYLPLESVHPQEQGFFQMADVIYSAICGMFN